MAIQEQGRGQHSLTGQFRIIYSLLILMVCGLLGAAWAQDGEIVSALGAVEVLRDGRWQQASVGEALNAGDTIRTGADSRAAIQLTSGTQLKLNGRSQVELKQVAPPTEGFVPTTTQMLYSVLKVLSGEIWVRNSGEALEIQTVPATATIRGTEFNLAVNPDDSAQLAVIDGLVEFSNPRGSVLVAANEQATVTLGEAPRKSVLLNPLDAVQWSFYYPDAGDSTGHEAIQAAQALLQHGRVAEARQALDQALARNPNDARAYGLRSNIALVQNQKAQALADAERAVAADPASPSAHLSLSLVKQAEFDLDAALAAAQKAGQLDPENTDALIQQSALLFGMGRVKDAFKLAERAKQKAPNDAYVNTVWGFIQLARYQVKAARAAFEAAISQDSTLGLPHLGLGLVHFRNNQTDAAVAEIRKATLLEPNVSLYNSYLGKAFYEANQDQRAEKYLAIAKRLDPRDPTPYLYDAIRLQSMNRPIAAVANLQKSIELNDDRAVYRSRLLLDEDQATRAAARGRIYNEVGFTQLGLNEGRESVSRNPTNASAHRLLADSYAAVPGIEAARASELLQAQLLQPVNINPVSPQQAETRLYLPAAGPITPSLFEFNPLFVRERPSLYLSGLGGSQDTWGDELIVAGFADRFSYSLGQFHYQSNGYRPNNDLENNLYSLFVQAAVTPELNLQAEYRSLETTSGDLYSNFNGSFNSRRRYNTEQETARIGARYFLSPQTDLLASVIYKDRDFLLTSPFNTLMTEEKGTLAETQLIYRAEAFNTVSGLSVHSLDYATDGVPFAGSLGVAYSYAHIKAPDEVIWTLGFSYDAVDSVSARLNELSPKLGVQWAISDQISLRAAAFKAVKRDFIASQTIEPTQVAGFNQSPDLLNATISKNYGLGLDTQFNNRLFGGLEVLRRDNEAPFGTVTSPDFYFVSPNQETFYSTYLYWIPADHWALSVALRYEQFEEQGCQFCRLLYPVQLNTLTLPLKIQYFHPFGFFAGASMVYVDQDIQVIDSSAPPSDPANISFPVLPKQNEKFTLFDVGLGYRLPKRQGIIAMEVKNLFDRQFNFQDYTFQTGGFNSPLYIPERTISLRFVLNF